jgi:trans-aconitate 2-methyltransferase
LEDWSAARYLKFESERTRPAADLLAGVPVRRRIRILDLGCGPGNSTALLTKKFPRAAVRGLDTSEDMLARARQRLPRVVFEKVDVADIAAWRSGGPLDLIFANAVLQWVPRHIELMAALVGELARGGCLAVQMPDNLDEPSHALMREVATRAPFSAKLADAAAARDRVGGFADYYAALAPLCARVDVWRTTYVHALQGPDAVIDWLSSTGLRPFLAPLDADERQSFLAQYRKELADAYPPLPDGRVLLPFPRLFIVASRAGRTRAAANVS